MARQDTACSDLDRSVQEHKNAAHYDELEKELLVNENYGEVSSAPWYVNLHDKISNILNRDKKRTFVTNTEIRKYLRKKYGPLEGERIELVNSIYQILKQNPTIARHFYKYVNGELGMLDAQKMRQQFPDYEITTFENSEGMMVPHLDTLPPAFVRDIYAELYTMVNGGKFFKNNIVPFRGIRIQLHEPNVIAKHDKTGMIFNVNESIDTWNNDAQTQISRYDDDLRFINHKMSELSDSMDLGDNGVATAYDFFFRAKMGELKLQRIEDSDMFQVMQYPKWVAPSPGAKHKFVADKKNPPVPFTYLDALGNEKEFILSSKLKGDQSQSEVEMFNDAFQRLRKMYNQVFDDVSTTVKRQNARRKKISKIAARNGTTDLLEEIVQYGIYSPDFDVQGLTRIDKQDDYYFTRMYHQDQIPTLLMKANNEMVNRRSLLESAIDGADLSDMTESDIKEYKNNIKKLERLDYDISIADSKRLDMENTILDTRYDERIQNGIIMKNFKRMTEIIHPKYARTDPQVLESYVGNMYRTIGRNNVTLTLMENIAENGRKAEAGAVDYVINHYKSTFYFPDADTRFFGIRTSSKVWANRINKLPGGSKVSPRAIENFFKGVSSLQIFNALNGPLQGLTNYSAVVMKIHDIGVEKYVRAISAYNKDPQKWLKMANAAGVTNYTDFIEGWIRTQSQELDEQVREKEIKLLTKLIAKADKTGNVRELIQYKDRRSKLRAKKLYQPLIDAAQWAITRKAWQKKNKNNIFRFMKDTALDFYGKLPSISETEENLRTLSFVIGVQNFLEQNAKQGFTEDSAEAIRSGINYTQRTDFGLSHQHVGLMFRGPLGGFLTRMKIWHTQRFKYDINVIKKAIRENTRPEMVLRDANGEYQLDGTWFDRTRQSTIGVAKTLAEIMIAPVDAGFGLFSKQSRQSKLRLDKVHTAKARSHFWLHGAMSAILDFAIYPVAIAPASGFVGNFLEISRGAFYKNPMGRGLTGFGSSFYSLLLGAGHFAYIMAKGGFDEDENISLEKFISKYAFHVPYIGLGTSLIFHLIAEYAHDHSYEKMRGLVNYNNNHSDKIQSFVLPGGNTTKNIYKATKEFLGADKKETLSGSYRQRTLVRKNQIKRKQ